MYLRWRWRTEEAAWSTSLPDPWGCLVPPQGRSITDCDAEEIDSWSRTFLLISTMQQIGVMTGELYGARKINYHSPSSLHHPVFYHSLRQRHDALIPRLCCSVAALTTRKCTNYSHKSARDDGLCYSAMTPKPKTSAMT